MNTIPTPRQPAIPAAPPKPPRSLTITLRQAERLLAFFGNHDCDVTITEAPAHWENGLPGLYAYCTESSEEGVEYLGATEVDDELAQHGRKA